MNYLEYVRDSVLEIEDIKDDGEAAQNSECGLYTEIVRWIADGSLSGEDAILCAKEALKTDDIIFARW